MALNFDYSKVDCIYTAIIAQNDDEMRFYKKGDKLIHPIMEAVIFRMLAIGINEISEENYMIAYQRSRFYEELFPETRMHVPLPAPFKGFEQRAIALEDFKNLIGLRTNISPEHEGPWRKRIIEQYVRELNNKIADKKVESLYQHYQNELPHFTNHE